MSPADLVSKLENLGYFRYTSETNLARVKENFRDGQFKFDFDRYQTEKVLGSLDMRWYSADAEDFAELGVAKFMSDLYSTLKLIGVPEYKVQNLDKGGYSYSISLNGQEIQIYSQEEAENAWLLAPKKVMILTNELLRLANSTERLYGQEGGNDQILAVLTPEIVEFLNKEFYQKPHHIYSVDEIDAVVMGE